MDDLPTKDDLKFWHASNYLDDDRAGIVDDDNRIIVPLTWGPKERAKPEAIVAWHNSLVRALVLLARHAGRAATEHAYDECPFCDVPQFGWRQWAQVRLPGEE